MHKFAINSQRNYFEPGFNLYFIAILKYQEIKHTRISNWKWYLRDQQSQNYHFLAYPGNHHHVEMYGTYQCLDIDNAGNL